MKVKGKENLRKFSKMREQDRSANKHKSFTVDSKVCCLSSTGNTDLNETSEVYK